MAIDEPTLCLVSEGEKKSKQNWNAGEWEQIFSPVGEQQDDGARGWWARKHRLLLYMGLRVNDSRDFILRGDT